MSPEEALDLAKTLTDVYSASVLRLTQAIASALTRGVESPRWAETALGETLRLRGEAQRIVAQLQQATTAEVPALLARVYAAEAGTTVASASVTKLAEDTVRVLHTPGPAILRWTEDVYRQVVAEASGPAVAGAASRREAAAKVVDRLTSAGQTGFTDAAGRRWALDTYAEMATRTAIGRAHLAGAIDGYLARGGQWTIVSDSPEECPRCRPYEGAVLSIAGDSPPPDSPGLRYMGTLAAAVAAGLHHPSCTHREHLYVPGLTRPLEFRLPTRSTANPDGYELRQRQRLLERRVRESKRRVEGLRPLGDTPTLAGQRRLLTQRRQALSEFVAEHDRKASVSAARTRLGGH